MEAAVRTWAPPLVAAAIRSQQVAHASCSWALRASVRWKKIAAKHTHNLHREPARPPTAGERVYVDPRSIPQYDLSALPDEFERLRKDPKSGPFQWTAAIAKLIGDRHVAHPHSHMDTRMGKEHYRIDFHNMYYLLHSSPLHMTYTAAQKRTLLNVLAHMHVFGPPTLKAEGEEEAEGPAGEEARTEA
mmetsp:Transcript_141705/g.395076  ORF Transcript_141705/g.395076 Transcript_141705/m.395076 type:complete len:188 (-) Transcript_141705:22-585(-)|eukprot:CAMPEP_0179147374 /NCGR_PEP_ID=MMETSP0796-20121207/71237_1 /TAXON_ID=73915 /ORGANISM="Pyrodinium bahamense, Strain pbaha01" /LENGTH=187 /DNA_ID=CAMNT_0020847963 /DNA_START=62 /DNA_END=625 /DNA_ORIENTATION=+